MNYKYTLLSKIHGKKGMAKEQDKKTSRGMSCGPTRTRRLLKSDSLTKSTVWNISYPSRKSFAPSTEGKSFVWYLSFIVLCLYMQTMSRLLISNSIIIIQIHQSVTPI